MGYSSRGDDQYSTQIKTLRAAKFAYLGALSTQLKPPWVGIQRQRGTINRQII